MKFMKFARAFIRQTFRSNSTVDINASGPKLNLQLSTSKEPLETRSGFDLNDKSSFYESDLTKLYNVYYSYQDTEEYRQGLLYTDIIGFKSADLYPVRESAFDIEQLVIQINPLPYKLPIELLEHGKSAIELFQALGKIVKDEHGEWENNQSLSIQKTSTTDNLITCRPANYFNQVSTNITLDWCSGVLRKPSATIRNSIEFPKDGKLKPLDNSALANTLGIAVMLYNCQLDVFIRVRSNALASINKQAMHCSASGVYALPQGTKPGQYDYSLIEQGIRDEIASEIGLLAYEYRLFPVAFARELPRGGKPQAFFIAITHLSDVEVQQRSKGAFESWEFEQSASHFRSYDNPASFIDAFTYEGWACFHLAQDFITANEAYLIESGLITPRS